MDVQADLHLCCLHKKGDFLMTWLILYSWHTDKDLKIYILCKISANMNSENNSWSSMNFGWLLTDSDDRLFIATS